METNSLDSAATKLFTSSTLPKPTNKLLKYVNEGSEELVDSSYSVLVWVKIFEF